MGVQVFDNPEAVAQAAADRFVQASTEAIAARGRFDVALSGGTTPKRVYQLLASKDYRNKVDWGRVHIFFGDERCVPMDHPDSNYRMVREALLSQVPIPNENIFPIQGDGDPKLNAQKYEQQLRKLFKDSDWPRFDLVFLGLGEDAHTASLFPGTSALHEDKAWVVANWVEKLNTWRITLTVPAINHAARILFLVTGSSKAKPLSAVINGSGNSPAQLINPSNGSLEWLIDKAAAELL
jgi:6-phosphogluconolactonase